MLHRNADVTEIHVLEWRGREASVPNGILFIEGPHVIGGSSQSDWSLCVSLSVCLSVRPWKDPPENVCRKVAAKRLKTPYTYEKLKSLHFCNFWSKKHSVFRYVLHYFSTWCRLVTFCPKSDAPDLCFPVSNRLCQKVEFSFFAKSIWDRKYKAWDSIFLTENHKMITCWKVLRTPTFLIGFSDPKWQNGHMLIWDRKNNDLDDAFWTKSGKRGLRA